MNQATSQPQATSQTQAESMGVRTLFTRPEGVSARARWLFLWLVVASTALILPPIFLTANGGLRVLALVSTAGLYALWVFGYLRRHSQVWTSVADAVGMVGFAVACPDSHAIMPILFSAVWFRSLVGTVWQTVARGVIYASAIGAIIALWPVFHPGPDRLEPLSFAGSLPTLFVTMFIVWMLGQTLIKRDESIARDRILASTGSRFLGTTDSAVIRALAWSVTEQFCAVTPGLVVLQVQSTDDGLSITGAAGHVGVLPLVLPSVVLTTPTDGTSARILDPRPLDVVVGASLRWDCLSLGLSSGGGWLLVGAPRSVPSEAVLSIRGLIGQVSLAMGNSRAHHELATQARTDSLTGLDNRGSFTRQVSRGIGETVSRAGVRVLFLDLDDFKNVNDELGHRAGDELLVVVGSRLRRGTRETDVCARLGGDEFAVLLKDASDQDAIELAERLVAMIAEPFVFDGHPIAVGASVGISSAAAANDLEDLLHQADVAMYAAKAGGKGRVVVFEPGLLQLGRTLGRSGAALGD
ncbi:diguanylate cyclase (GGDEF)-like protein [Cryobacterium sp. MP_M5]|uniref:GGDEF domain-containing protein n=1 Tax=unclassified Cryobacterium TaxID=2649013 RepID=UPI0018CAF2AC|nr:MULTISPECIES: GGDEF domain-containing protein [unclassified Cryobacterium]MBG6056611.1 diguanylate cyclase (GGDEF)-like protein [Cryobacterium sp. MP_M3]MEC5176283.1 diguanylate cyclase (GGDEF)-like protein [Cryobacterium sp. MP_M5]